MGAEHTYCLILKCVGNKGKVLVRVYVLRNQIHAFFLEKKSSLTELFTDERLLTLSYLSDIFLSLNKLSLKLQDSMMMFSETSQKFCKLSLFLKSLKLWLALLSPNPSHYMFPTVLQPGEENDITDTQVKHLTGLIKTHFIYNFDHYYPKGRYKILCDKSWIQNPFEFESPESLLELGLTAAEGTELL